MDLKIITFLWKVKSSRPGNERPYFSSKMFLFFHVVVVTHAFGLIFFFNKWIPIYKCHSGRSAKYLSTASIIFTIDQNCFPTKTFLFGDRWKLWAGKSVEQIAYFNNSYMKSLNFINFIWRIVLMIVLFYNPGQFTRNFSCS